MSDKLDQYHLFNIGDCRNCNQPYVDPYILNCLHTFCLGCIINMSKENDPKCVVCREKFEIQSNGMPQHYSNGSFEDLSKIRTIMGSVKPGHSKCDLCKKNPATEYCRECKFIICPHDSKMHKKATKDEHEIFKLEYLQDYNNIFKLIPENTMNYCKQHPEKLIQFYCYRCNVVLCTECAHGGHMEDPCYANEMNSMFHGRREMVIQRQVEHKSKVDSIFSENERLKKMVEEITKQEQDILNKINKDFEDHIEQLTQRQNQLTNSIRRVFANRRTEIEKAIDSQNNFTKESNHLLEMSSFYLNDLPGTHLFPPAVALCNKMDKLERVRATVNTDLNPLEFIFSKDAQFVNDPKRIGKLAYRFPLGFENPKFTIDLNLKMKLPFQFQITGMAKTSNGDMQLLLHESEQKKNSKSNSILRLNSFFLPLQNSKLLESLSSLDEYTNISHFNATPDGTTLIVDRGIKQFQAISNGRIHSSISGDASMGTVMLDPYNVVGREGEGFIVYNKDKHTIEVYTSDSKLENQFEIYHSTKLSVPSTPTVKRSSHGCSTPDPSSENFGFLSFPPKCITPEHIPKPHQPYSNLQIGCNSFGEIYYVSDTKPIIKRFSPKGEELKEFKFADQRTETTVRVTSSSKVPVNAKPLQRSETLRGKSKNSNKPNLLAIPIQVQAPTKPKSSRTLIAIDVFNNVYVYQSGHIYILDMSLENVRTRGKINFEPDYMLVSEVGHLILTTRFDAKIRVY